MSIAGGVSQALWRGKQTGCDVIQLFTKNASQWCARPLTPDDRAAFQQAKHETGVIALAAHGSYLINLASPDRALYERSQETLREEMQQAEALRLPYLVMHPGSHRGSGEEQGLSRIAGAINFLDQRGTEMNVMILLETTAGQGAILGNRFEHLARIIEMIEKGERVGVCLDTCHVFAAGYDISTAEGYEATLEAFHRIIGLDRLKIIHLNDSKAALGTRRDRHAHIGHGYIGLDAFRRLLRDPRLAHLPFVLETPDNEDWDVVNLGIIRGLL
jgi:deoxyribonuclease-4